MPHVKGLSFISNSPPKIKCSFVYFEAFRDWLAVVLRTTALLKIQGCLSLKQQSIPTPLHYHDCAWPKAWCSDSWQPCFVSLRYNKSPVFLKPGRCFQRTEVCRLLCMFATVDMSNRKDDWWHSTDASRYKVLESYGNNTCLFDVSLEPVSYRLLQMSLVTVTILSVKYIVQSGCSIWSSSL